MVRNEFASRCCKCLSITSEGILGTEWGREGNASREVVRRFSTQKEKLSEGIFSISVGDGTRGAIVWEWNGHGLTIGD